MRYAEINGVKCVEITPPAEGDIYFFGLKRSGNHAILDWVLSHFESYYHYNNVFIHENKYYVDFVSDVNVAVEPPYTPKVYSFEDRKEFSNTNPLIEWGRLPPGKRIMIIRDPYNMYASRLQIHRNPNPEFPQLVKIWLDWTEAVNLDLWISFAKEFIGETDHLGKCIKINYNQWIEDKKYKNELSALHFDTVGKEIDYTHKAGGGSSFYGLAKPDKDKLKTRWKHFAVDEEFSRILANREIARLSKIIFGFAHSQVRCL